MNIGQSSPEQWDWGEPGQWALGQWPHCGAGPCVPVWCEPVTPRVEAGGTPPTFRPSCLAPLSLPALLLSCYLLLAGEEGLAVGCLACWLLGCLGAWLAVLANPVSGTPSPTATTTTYKQQWLTPLPTLNVPPPLPQVHHNIHHYCLYYGWMHHLCCRQLSYFHLAKKLFSMNLDGYTSIPGDTFSLIVVTSHLVHIPLMQYFPLDFTLAHTPVNTIHHLPLTLDIGTELIWETGTLTYTQLGYPIHLHTQLVIQRLQEILLLYPVGASHKQHLPNTHHLCSRQLLHTQLVASWKMLSLIAAFSKRRLYSIL